MTWSFQTKSRVIETKAHRMESYMKKIFSNKKSTQQFYCILYAHISITFIIASIIWFSRLSIHLRSRVSQSKFHVAICLQLFYNQKSWIERWKSYRRIKAPKKNSIGRMSSPGQRIGSKEILPTDSLFQ